MIIPKDATPPARGEPDAFHTPKTLETVLESPGSAFRRVPQSPLTTPLAQIRGRPPRPFASARMPPPPRRLGGLSRRDVGVALVVAGLGALTLAATVVGA